jgi:DNA invertase Pin-like site-specific DNA recombinase
MKPDASKKKELRRRIREAIEKFDEATLEDVVADVSRLEQYDEAEVLEILNEFQLHGFVYVVEQDDGSKEVRLT